MHRLLFLLVLVFNSSHVQILECIMLDDNRMGLQPNEIKKYENYKKNYPEAFL